MGHSEPLPGALVVAVGLAWAHPQTRTAVSFLAWCVRDLSTDRLTAPTQAHM